MTKDVLLAMKGMQFELNENTGENDNIEIITAAQYFCKGNHSYILYDEFMEGIDTPVSNMIKFDNGMIEVTKKGPINVHMVFEAGKQNLTDYQTPFGNIVIGINTHKVNVSEEDQKITLQADYGLDINYEFLSECQISMEISPRETLKLS